MLDHGYSDDIFTGIDGEVVVVVVDGRRERFLLQFNTVHVVVAVVVVDRVVVEVCVLAVKRRIFGPAIDLIALGLDHMVVIDGWQRCRRGRSSWFGHGQRRLLMLILLQLFVMLSERLSAFDGPTRVLGEPVSFLWDRMVGVISAGLSELS